MTSQDHSSRSRQSKPLTLAGNPIPDDLDEQLIHKVVHQFYARIREDELLAPVFNEKIAASQWPVHLDKMCDFWSSSLLRTNRYNGRPLPPHLGIPELNDAHFERWLSLFRQTVAEACSTEAAAIFYDLARRVAHSFRLSLAFHRGEDTVGLQRLGEVL